MTQLLTVVAITGTGIVAGVFFAIAVSVLPTLFAMAPAQYVWTHQLLGKGYHPVMPLVVTVALVCDVVLAVLVDGPTARVLFVAAAVLLVAVQVVSQFGNVPINREVNKVRPEAIPSDWRDPRPPWRRWHTVRTVCALLALGTAAAAAVAG